MTAHDDVDQDAMVAGFDAHVEESSRDVDGAVEDIWKFASESDTIKTENNHDEPQRQLMISILQVQSCNMYCRPPS